MGSVLIARHGRLVYEEYFDGGKDELRDTRSVTKSITDILIGIAIDEHKLSDVHTTVLDLLPEHKLVPPLLDSLGRVLIHMLRNVATGPVRLWGCLAWHHLAV